MKPRERSLSGFVLRSVSIISQPVGSDEGLSWTRRCRLGCQVTERETCKWYLQLSDTAYNNLDSTGVHRFHTRRMVLLYLSDVRVHDKACNVSINVGMSLAGKFLPGLHNYRAGLMTWQLWNSAAMVTARKPGGAGRSEPFESTELSQRR